MIYRFGRYELDEEAGELRREGQAVSVQPKPLALLGLLIRERARLVSLDELFARLWPDAVVTPASLTRAVSHARRAIGDTHRGTWIRSYARRGYRFCGEVLEIGGGVAAAPPDAPAPGAAEPRAAGLQGRTPFVGREDSLGLLCAAWERAARGAGCCALVRGRAGIGKTGLADVFAAEVRRRGGGVLVGRAREGEGVPAFWIWADLLRQLLAEGDADTAALAEHGGELAALLPELSARAPTPVGDRARSPVSPEQRRFLFFDAVVRTLGAASRKRPLLIVLEDLQWVRAPALALLEHLVFELPRTPILLLATLREVPREHAHPLARVLSQLLLQEGSVEVRLQSLSRGEVGALLEQALGHRPPADLTSALFARTEGVPLFLREGIRLLAERGELRNPERLARQGPLLPGRAVDLIRRSLGSVSEPCSRLIGAAAVVGREFALPLVASAADCARDAALDLLDEATRAGVVEALPEAPATWRFSHALFQEAAYEALAPGERARLHQRVARRLEEQHGGDDDLVIAELAHHHHQALAVGDPERALRCAQRAAQRALRLHAYEQAALHHEQAVAALDQCDGVASERRLETLLALGEAWRLAGDRARWREVYADAIAAASALARPREQARAAIGFCDLAEWALRDEPAEAAVSEALEALGEERSLERVKLATRRAYLYTRVRPVDAERWARDALALAREVGDREALQEALYTLHLILAGPDHLAEREQLVRDIVESADGAAGVDAALIAAIDIASDRVALGDAAGARAWRERAGRIAGDRPHPGRVWHMRVYDTGIALMEGRLDEAEALAEQAVVVGDRIGHPYARGCFTAHQVDLARERGRHGEALERFGPAADRGRGPAAWLNAVAARGAFAAGDVAEARRRFAGLAGQGFDAVPRNIRWTRSLVAIAHLAADLGEEEAVPSLLALLAPVEDHHAVLPVPVCYGGPVSHACARLQELAHRLDAAEELYEAAADSTAALGARPARVRVLADHVALLARRGARSRAAALRGQALALAEEVGMEPPAALQG